MLVTVRRSFPRYFGVEGSAGFALAVDDGDAQALILIEQDQELDIPQLVVSPEGFLRAELIVDGAAIGFEVVASDEDRIEIDLIRPDHAVFTVIHARPMHPCEARCYDGTVGQPCVDCERDGRTVRICC